VQIYAALYNVTVQGPQFLIVKKREFNNWWKLKGDARQGGPPHLVNQAGQWAFPGGRAETGDWTGEAKREFTEETGLPFPNHTPRQIYKKGRSYSLYVFEVTDSMANLVDGLRANVAPNASNAWAPANVAVEDWELSDAAVVPLERLTGFLGVRQPVSGGTQAVITALHPGNYSQAVDWYGEMAAALRANFGSGLIVNL
jgi:8-oxo-dGTP pyrophosphatase MutT (NUDIX family)